jgi:YD repeat-containing protein
MTDGLGMTSYAYDSLSRLTSETRNLTNVGSYAFNYTYNLSGQLTALQDAGEPSRNVGYTRDKIGRLTDVGAGGFGGVANYATGIQYRAFGSMKAMTYGTGSGKQTSYSYNNRLQLSNYGVSDAVAQTDFQYYSDGKVKFVSDNINHDFDRLYKYDYAGRLTEGLTGAKARGETTLNGGLYQETFGFNAFGNLTNRTGWVWGVDGGEMTATYQNNRRNDNIGYQYDADGRNTAADTLEIKYDASGKQTWTRDENQRRRLAAGLGVSQSYDGDGQRVKQGTGNQSTYYVRSSALGGAVVYELRQYNTGWRKEEGFIYANGQMIAQQSLQHLANQPRVDYLYTNPITHSQRGTAGDPMGGAEYDPMENPIGLAAPEPDSSPDMVSDLVIPRYADALNLTSGCTIDGAAASCDASASAADAMDSSSFGMQVTRNFYEADAPLPTDSIPGQPTIDNPKAGLVTASGPKGGANVDPTFFRPTIRENQSNPFSDVLATVQSEHIKNDPLATTNRTLGNGFVNFRQTQTKKPRGPMNIKPDTTDPGIYYLGHRLGEKLKGGLVGLSNECLQGLAAFGATTTDLLDAFRAADFLSDPNETDDGKTSSATTRYNPGKGKNPVKSVTISTKNGITTFLTANLGFLIHELSHATKEGNSDKVIYTALKKASANLPNAATPDRQGYSDAISAFFNRACN